MLDSRRLLVVSVLGAKHISNPDFGSVESWTPAPHGSPASVGTKLLPVKDSSNRWMLPGDATTSSNRKGDVRAFDGRYPRVLPEKFENRRRPNMRRACNWSAHGPASREPAHLQRPRPLLAGAHCHRHRRSPRAAIPAQTPAGSTRC